MEPSRLQLTSPALEGARAPTGERSETRIHSVPRAEPKEHLHNSLGHPLRTSLTSRVNPHF